MTTPMELINELKEKLIRFRTEFEKVFKYNNHKFYQKKSFDLMKDLRATQLKLRKLKENIKKKKIKEDIQSIISLLDNLITSKTLVKEDVLDNLDTLDLQIQDLEINSEDDCTNFQERIYDKGSRFDFHLDIKEIRNSSAKDLFIIEPFVEDHLLEITLKDVKKGLNIRILTNPNNMKYSGNFTKLGSMFKSQQKGIFEVRESIDVHDRGIFCDLNEGWVMGQSIKDGAKRPTYLIKLREPKKLKDIYERIWSNSKKII